MKATTKQLCAFANLKRVEFQYPVYETFFYYAGQGWDSISMFVPSLDDVYIISMSSEFAFNNWLRVFQFRVIHSYGLTPPPMGKRKIRFIVLSRLGLTTSKTVPINPSTAEWALRALIDFTLANARRFYSSVGNPLDGKGLSMKIRNKTNKLGLQSAFLTTFLSLHEACNPVISDKTWGEEGDRVAGIYCWVGWEQGTKIGFYQTSWSSLV